MSMCVCVSVCEDAYVNMCQYLRNRTSSVGKMDNFESGVSWFESCNGHLKKLCLTTHFT